MIPPDCQLGGTILHDHDHVLRIERQLSGDDVQIGADHLLLGQVPESFLEIIQAHCSIQILRKLRIFRLGLVVNALYYRLRRGDWGSCLGRLRPRRLLFGFRRRI